MFPIPVVNIPNAHRLACQTSVQQPGHGGGIGGGIRQDLNVRQNSGLIGQTLIEKFKFVRRPVERKVRSHVLVSRPSHRQASLVIGQQT